MALGAPALSLEPLLCSSEPCPRGRDAHPQSRTRSALCARPPPGAESRVELGTAQIIPASLQNWDSDVWMAGQRVGTAEQELRERWERRLLCTVTAAQPGLRPPRRILCLQPSPGLVLERDPAAGASVARRGLSPGRGRQLAGSCLPPPSSAGVNGSARLAEGINSTRQIHKAS